VTGARVTGVARWQAGALGAAAALASTASLGRSRLATLLRPNEAGRLRGSSADVALALGVAGRGLAALDRRLGWVPLAHRPWRNSCLYRSVAQCMVLRWYGRVAYVALGAGFVEGDAVGAHAWVVYDGPEPVERPAADFVTFRPAAPPRR